jgi:signal transduction histidine kinase
MLPHPDTAFHAALLAGGAELAHAGHDHAGPSATVPIFPGGDFSLAVTLNPAILPVLLSAAAPPAWPVLVGALAASTLLSLIALLLLRQLRRTVARREAFVASISHELRTPLTEVLLHAESLHLDRQTPDAKARAATAIVRETRRLIGLVENALTFAGAGRSREAPPRGLLSAAEVIRQSLRSLEPAMAHREARVSLALEEMADSPIDPTSLDRIVTNLVENALRYGPAGQTIRVGLARANGAVQLTVDDEGPGIPAGERARIWDPFQRGAAAWGNAAGGVGLGLAIVRHLAELSGGSARATTAPGGGARFVVTLPAIRHEE